MRIAIFAVLAGAYRDSRPASMLTHAVWTDDHGVPDSALCRRVILDNLTEHAYPNAGPTCKSCQRAMLRAARCAP